MWSKNVDQPQSVWQLGLNVNSLALAARAAVDGAIVGDFSLEGDNIDLVIIPDPAIEMTPDRLAETPLAVTEENDRQTIVPLGDLVRFAEADASQSIRRAEQRRAVRFVVNPPPEMALEQAQARIEELVAESRREDVCRPLPPREAICQSVKTRIRPIFMTTLTSVFGMLPLVLAPGAGSELYRGLGAVVVGGLICSTLLFSLVIDAKALLSQALFGARQLPWEPEARTERGDGPAEVLHPVSTV